MLRSPPIQPGGFPDPVIPLGLVWLQCWTQEPRTTPVSTIKGVSRRSGCIITHGRLRSHELPCTFHVPFVRLTSAFHQETTARAVSKDGRRPQHRGHMPLTTEVKSPTRTPPVSGARFGAPTRSFTGRDRSAETVIEVNRL